MRIVIDAMGTDTHPSADVAGGVLAAREFGDDIIFVGDSGLISAELNQHTTTGLKIHIEHAAEAIGMSESPATVTREKKQSSIHVGLGLVKSGSADAFVSAGNTGAVLAIATLSTLRRIKGIKRPAIGVLYPVPGFPLGIDNGANVDCKPEYLQQFGVMGSAYMQHVQGIAKPRVCLISNGSEDSKGNELVKAAAPLLADSPIHFIGNMEPKAFFAGGADVGVTDGFTGNIMLKSAEAIARVLLTSLRDQIMSSQRTKVGGLLARPAFDAVRKQLDPDEVGGAPLLGVNGVVIIAHGGSSPLAIKQAVGKARLAVQNNIVAAIADGVSSSKPNN